ncbi:MAG: acryloyl-CoA reductase [Actinomycetota bacterium]|nr:acryloyl-CoA reductase [Actinomycetota bacterium]
MSVPETFPAFVAEQDGDDVRRGVQEFAAAGLHEGDVTIRVTHSSVNYKDALATIPKGGVARTSPLIPGVDAVGEDVESGATVLVTGHGLGVAHHGGWAQYARVPGDWVLELPDGLAPREAMALGTAGLTAGLSLHALEARGLAPGDGPVLVLGSTGGVGSVAVGALAAAGYEVVAATGKEDEHDYLRGLGASDVIGRDEVTAAPERPLEKQRWAGVVDPVGGAATAYAVRTTRYGGAVAVSGLTAGPKLETTVLPFILRGVSLLGIESVDAPVELRRDVWRHLATDWRPAGLEESIAREIGLDGIEPVLDTLLAGKAVGRTVVAL